MIVFLLLLIVVIMLFGAAAVRGLIGKVIGFAALVLGLTVLVTWASTISSTVWTVIGGVVAALFFGALILDKRLKRSLQRNLTESYWGIYAPNLLEHLTKEQRSELERKRESGDAEGLLTMFKQLSQARLNRIQEDLRKGTVAPCLTIERNRDAGFQ